MTPSSPWFGLGDGAGGSLMATSVCACDDRWVATTSTSHARGGPPPDAAAVDAVQQRKFYRSSDGRLVGGVAAGLASHLGLQPLTVRVSFALLAALNGFGLVLYLALWMFTPLDQAEREKNVPAGIAAATRSGKRRRLRGPSKGDLGQLMALVLLGAGLILLVQRTPLGVSPAVFVPVLLAGLGVALIWRTADEHERRSMAAISPRAPWLAALLGKGGVMAVFRIVAGIAVIVAGVVAFLVGQGELQATLDSLLGVAAVIGGLALILGPWLWRLWRDLDTERNERIVSQERADVAAHLHDSVLQTLALIQKHAHDPREVVRLARSQERDLRGWLYADRADDATSFTAALKKAAAEVEDAHGVPVEVVTVGDVEIDNRIRAVLSAAREATVNAAKHSGADKVDIFAEVDGSEVELFVRDRGSGFDPDSVPDDRLGVRRSIVDRMERHGGIAQIRSTVGEGTEVRLSTRRP
jgi:signal transduction histidine kinase/phage shock protein PspC (stress-responsive transcriptional regulator)